MDHEGQAKLAGKAAAMGVELFVVDDGWFGARDDDRAGLGDWVVNRRKFPEGLAPLIDRVRSLGMQFGIWVEPEMVNPDSDLYRAHPDWIYHFPTRPRTEARNQLIVNLGRDDVQDHLFDALDGLLSENDISFVKRDMNRPFSEPGWPEAPGGRDREVWVRHVRGLYELLGRLRERRPQVDFESCSGGGGRADLGILRPAEQVWTSDNTDPHDRLFIQEGFSMAYPARAMACWVADGSEAVMFVLRHPHNLLATAPRLYPRGLRAGAVYEVSGEESPVSGAALMSRGVGVGLSGDLASAMIELREARRAAAAGLWAAEVGKNV